jgi:DNA repair ATPase RecN
MSLQISNVLIWQQNGKLRNLEFKKNAVNVITGDSGKGKSSILYVIDYCLLASSAKGISKENIDRKSDWYGIRLWTSQGLVTIARPAVHKDNIDSAYFSGNGEIPEQPTSNMSLHNIKLLLDRELGLNSDLKVPYGGRTIKAGSKISFRSFLPFCYQDQTALVSPDYLYIRPSDQKMVERIERVFRMAIGIVDAEGAIVRERLESLKSKKDSLMRRIDSIAGKRLEFEEDILSLKDEAEEMGLVENDTEDPVESLELLKSISNQPIEYFTKVEEQSSFLEKEKFKLNNRLKRYKTFTEGYKTYQKFLKEGDDSLSSINFLLENYEAILPGTNTQDVLTALERQLLSVRASWKENSSSIFFVDIKEKSKNLENEIQEVEKKLTLVKDNENSLSTPEKIYKYQGRIEAKIAIYSDKSVPVDYSEGLSKLNAQITELEGKSEHIDSKKEFVFGQLNKLINSHLENLKLKGYENSQAVFIENKRAINLILDEGKSVEKMEDIGSASNYLYIHLSYFMALHEIAKKNSVSWMPSFLILDQVSTPYSGETADDIASLDSALIELNLFVQSMDKLGGFQIILMEHIPERHWTNLGLDRFRLVDRELIGDHGLIN